MEKISLRVKLFFLCFGPSIVAIIILGVYLMLQYTEKLEETLEQKGYILTEKIINDTKFALYSANQQMLRGIINSAVDTKDIQSITVYDRDGTVLISSGNRKIKPQPLAVDTQSMRIQLISKTPTLRYLAPISLQKIPVADPALETDTTIPDMPREIIGWLSVDLDKTDIQKLILEESLLLLVLIIAAILFLLLTEYYMNKQFSKPLHELMEDTQKLVDKNFTTPIATPDDPELKVLAKNINLLQDRIKIMQYSMYKKQIKKNKSQKKIKQKKSGLYTQNLLRHHSEILARINGVNSLWYELIKENGQDKTEILNKARHELATLRLLIDETFSLAALSSMDSKQDKVFIDLSNLVFEVLKNLFPLFITKKIYFYTVYDTKDLSVIGDKVHLRQLLTTLIRYCTLMLHPEEIILSVNKKNIRKNQQALYQFNLQIQQSALDEEELEKIFIQPLSVKQASTHVSMGTSLELIQAQLQFLGAEINIHSKEKNIKISLSTTLIPRTEQQLQNTTVLGYASRELMHDEIASILKQWQIHYIKNTDFPTLFSACNNPDIAFDVVLFTLDISTDINMIINELITPLKDHFEGPIIIIGQYLQPHDIQALFQQGVNQVFIKPILPEELYHFLCQLMIK